jgi:nicotinamidase-related amidase
MEQNTSNNTLLVLDMQAAILAMVPGNEALIKRTAKAIAHARKNNIPVIYITVGFRKGSPEINLNNKSFASIKERFANIEMADFIKIHPDLLPLDDELVVVKRRVSAFTGSDLEVILRALNIRHLVISGVATSGAVLSTVRESADKDYRITVLSDCCGDGDEEVHRVLTTKVFPRQAEVITVKEWTDSEISS